MRSPRRRVLGAALALALAGCGQPGDLYMPKPAPRPAPKTAAPQPAVGAPAPTIPASPPPAVN